MKLSDAEKGGSGLQLGMQERMSLYRNPDGSITVARQVKGQENLEFPVVTDAQGSKHRRVYWAKASLTATEVQILFGQSASYGRKSKLSTRLGRLAMVVIFVRNIAQRITVSIMTFRFLSADMKL